MNLKQKEQLKIALAELPAKERKEVLRQAGELRAKAQSDPKNLRGRWSVDLWQLQLIEERANRKTAISGTVLSLAKGKATVKIGEEHRVCELAKEIAEKQQSLIGPGDEVRLEILPDWTRVAEVLPRRTVLTRRDPHFRERDRIIVANIDRVGIVVSVVAPSLHPRLIDRYLGAIHKGGAQAFVVVNKIDLHEDAEDLQADLDQLKPYVDMGVPVFPVSTSAQLGIEPLRRHLAGQVSVFVGHSGVGKSSMVNALAGTVVAEAGSIAEVGKGRHTTTHSELVEIGDIRIFDTPGIREFSVDFKSPQDVAECFEEFLAVGRCRFADCIHVEEPGCAVREGVSEGRISRARFESYLRLIAPMFEKATNVADEAESDPYGEDY